VYVIGVIKTKDYNEETKIITTKEKKKTIKEETG